MRNGSHGRKIMVAGQMPPWPILILQEAPTSRSRQMTRSAAPGRTCGYLQAHCELSIKVFKLHSWTVSLTVVTEVVLRALPDFHSRRSLSLRAACDVVRS